MRAVARLTFFIMLAIAFLGIVPVHSAPARPAAHRAASAHRPAHTLHRPRFRPPRGAAARDAARLGALVGKECHGQADMPRNDHEWIVMCSNGRTFVVQPPLAGQPGAPPIECSLAGSGPQPACYGP